MLRCFALIAGLAFGLALADEAAGQSAGAGGSAQARPRLFNPFMPFSFSRLTVNPFGLPAVSKAPSARRAPNSATTLSGVNTAPTSASDDSGF
jgi:hypothetical protein